MSKGKDPAFLFYSDNFLTGTMFFSDEQVGKYIRLLCAQHLTGHLLEKDMLKICKTHNVDIWDKFVQDKGGKYYNVRLENEIIKRKKFTESRAKNRSGKNKEDKLNVENPLDTYVTHMGNGDGNENVIEIENENKGGTGGNLTREDQIAIYQIYTTAILQKEDQHFEQLAMKERVTITEEAVKDHLALLCRYPNMQPNTVTEFRQSLIKHCKDFKIKTDGTTPKDEFLGTFNLTKARKNMADAARLDELERAKNAESPN